MHFSLSSVEFRYYNVCINMTQAIGILYIFAMGLGSQIHKDSLCKCNTQLGSLKCHKIVHFYNMAVVG